MIEQVSGPATYRRHQTAFWLFMAVVGARRGPWLLGRGRAGRLSAGGRPAGRVVGRGPASYERG